MSSRVIAVDLGATSGRVIEGFVGPNRLDHSVAHRFPNGPIEDGAGLRWNVTGLFREVLRGLRAVGKSNDTIVSVGVDSWAVDYGLLKGGVLLKEPRHYRDTRTAESVERIHQQADHAALFERNGLQFLPFNSIYQLAAEDWSGQAGTADQLLLVPDLMNFWLTGNCVMEHTNASTTGLLNVVSQQLDEELIALSGASLDLFAPLVSSGHLIGDFQAQVAEQVGFSAPVVTVGSHDTASAVVAAPLRDSASAYISLGTWGLAGIETASPIVTPAARAANFTNEGGVDGRNRFLRNVMGLWLLNESVAWWAARGETRGLGELLQAAADVPVSQNIFDVDDPMFMAPGNIPERIIAWGIDRGLGFSADPVPMVSLIVDSLVHALGVTVRAAGELAGTGIHEISVVGGGSQNALLNQRLANQTGVVVVAGPVEATALGNILVQAREAGLIQGDLDSLRALVRSCSNLVTYTPQGETHHG